MNRKKIRWKCKTCGSTEIRWDAWAEWNEITQQDELHSTFDYCWCEKCEGETKPAIEEFEVDNIKYIFLQIDIREGEREHNHKLLFTTKCNNLEFAVQWYIAHYWGYAEKFDGTWWYHDMEICVKSYSYKELDEDMYNTLSKYI